MQFTVKQLIATLQQLPNQSAKVEFWNGDTHVHDIKKIECKDYSTLDESTDADTPLPQTVTISVWK